LERVPRLLVAMVGVEALGRDEDVLAVEARRAERLADLGLVLVGGRGVDVAVARPERAGDGLGGVLGRHLEDAEAELGDLRVAAQRDARYLIGLGGHKSALPVQMLCKRSAARRRCPPMAVSCGTLCTCTPRSMRAGRPRAGAPPRAT